MHMDVSRKRQTSNRKTQGGPAVRARLCTRRKEQGTEHETRSWECRRGRRLSIAAPASMLMDRRVGKVWTTLGRVSYTNKNTSGAAVVELKHERLRRGHGTHTYWEILGSEFSQPVYCLPLHWTKSLSASRGRYIARERERDGVLKGENQGREIEQHKKKRDRKGQNVFSMLKWDLLWLMDADHRGSWIRLFKANSCRCKFLCTGSRIPRGIGSPTVHYNVTPCVTF
jgi:hypothetical protein